MSEKAFDVVLYGATGFTGRQAAAYFAKHVGSRLRWAIAGRSEEKLNALKASLGEGGVHAGVLVADSSQPESVDAMVARTRVLLTTAGPFALYGTPVVAACVKHRTDYVDITGETLWVRGLIDAFHEEAAAGGVRIVPFCGFDSVPSDLGALMMVNHLREQRQTGTRRVTMYVRMRGGLNGGTLATALNQAETDPEGRYKDPVLLNPEPHRTDAERARNPDESGAKLEPDLPGWTVPFFMAPINTRVVRRSHALASLAGQGYGPEFCYSERLWVGGPTAGRKARMIASAAEFFEAGMSYRWVRGLVKLLGPAPGSGPSEATMDGGMTRCVLLAEGMNGSHARGELAFAGDPGNRLTVTMLCECARALAEQRDELPGGPGFGGILTPATAFGQVGIARLRAAGVRMEVPG